MGLVARLGMTKSGSRQTKHPCKIHGKDTHMTLINDLRDRLAKRAAYNRTRFEIANLPRDIAIEDLGIVPSEAHKIAARAVYG